MRLSDFLFRLDSAIDTSTVSTISPLDVEVEIEDDVTGYFVILIDINTGRGIGKIKF